MMPDPSPNPAPNDKPADDDPFAGLGMTNIDDLLAEAEALASDVADEVGVDEAPAEEAAPAEAADTTAEEADDEPDDARDETTDDTPPDAPDDAPDDVIAAIEAIIPDTPEEGADAASQAVEAALEVAEGVTTQANEPEVEAAAEPVETDATLANEAAALLDAVAEFGGEVGEAPFGTEAGDSPVADNDTADGRLAALLRRTPAPVRRVGTAVFAWPLYGLVGVCRAIDMPFAWMSPSLKSKIGYVAIATAFMAAVAWSLVLTGVTS